MDSPVDRSPADQVLGWFARLDLLLAAAVDARGGLDEVELPGGAASSPPTLPPGAAFLQQRYGLSGFDLALLMIAIAPEIDLRYEAVYAYLQDDPARPAPTVELALNLLCATATEKLSRRAHFAADSPLVGLGMVRLSPETGLLSGRRLVADEQIIDTILGVSGLDRRLSSWCQVVQLPDAPQPLPWTDPAIAGLAGWPQRLYLQGARGSGRRTAAVSRAAAAGAPLLIADLRLAPQADFADAVRILVREAELFGAILYLRDVDTLDAGRQLRLEAAMNNAPVMTILSGRSGWIPSGEPVTVVQLSTPDAAGRAACWRASLERHGLWITPEAVDVLAARFRLNPGQIELAVAQARAAGDDDLAAAARAQTGHELAALARRIEPRATWSDIVLPDETSALLRELCDRAATRQVVLEEWGFGRKLAAGTGTAALFLGPSGTGKTFAAEVVAAELGLDLFKIDLSGVVSKYIGETEKNLDRIFQAATDANGVLFMDEAEALLGKRSEVRDSHDRYANIEVAYLLQKMEEYEGIAILATNLAGNLDEAFIRRLAFSVHFPLPDEAGRRRIWSGIWPPDLPLADDLDLDHVAREFTLTGGNIKNAALAASFTAAADGRVVTNAHLLHAIRREFQKLGKNLTDSDLRIGAAS